MLNWLWKWMGYHVCEEFTQWTVRETKMTRPLLTSEMVALGLNKEAAEGYCAVTERHRWQERRCTICGKIEERELYFTTQGKRVHAE